MPIQLLLDPPQLFGLDLLSPLRNLLNWLIDNIVSLINRVVSFLNENVVSKIVSGLNWVFTKVRELINGFVQSIINLIKGLAPMTPEKAVESIIKIVGLISVSGLAIMSILTAMNIQVFGCKVDMSFIASFIRSLLSPQLFAGALIGVILGVGFRIPLTYWANYVFRPNLPDMRMAYSMMVKGIITEETFNYVMRYKYGFNEEWIKAIKRELTYTPTPFEIMRLADYVSLDPVWVSKKLNDVGMEEWDKSKFIEAILKRPIREEMRALFYEIGTQYIYGLMSLEECKKKLLENGMRPEELALTIPRLILVRKRILIDQKIDVLKQLFRKEVITKDTLKIKLRELGLAEENVNIIVAYELALKGQIE